MAIRILIIDDSSTVRQLLTEIFRDERGCEVIGWAGNGIDGLAKIRSMHPDVVIMDVEMPLLDGVEALAELMETTPVPVIMFSSHTPKGASTTLMALDLGAVDVLEKPSRSADWNKVQQMIVNAVRAAAGANLNQRQQTGNDLPVLKAGDYDVIVIGCSTGGPAALSRLLPLLPDSCPLPVVVAQHMPDIFLTAMAARLNRYCPMDVTVAVDGLPVEGGKIWIAPGGTQTTLVRRGGELVFGIGSVTAYTGPYQPSVDLLLESAAQTCGSRVLACILTGMGRDGLKGAGKIHKARGFIIAQDRESSVIYGMPGAVHDAGLASMQLSLVDIGIVLRNFGR